MEKEMISVRKDKLEKLLTQVSNHLPCRFCPFGYRGSCDCNDMTISVTCRGTLEEILKG